MKFNFPFAWYNKFGTIPETYKEAMSYEEQILWLCKHQDELQTTITENYSELTSLIENAIDELDEAKQDKLIAGENIQIDGNVISSYNGEDLTSQLTLNSYFGDYNVGETLPSSPIAFEDTASIIILEGASPVTYKIKGNYIVYEIDSSTREILEKDSATLTDSYGTFVTNGNRTLIVEFSATNTYEARIIKLESESSGGVNYITELSENLIITDTSISLEDGFYYTGDFKVLTSEEPVTTLIDTDSIFYYNSTGGVGFTPIFQVLLDKDNSYILKYNVEYVSSQWQRVELSTTGAVSSSSTNLQIPTAKAVYDFVSAFPASPITTLSQNVTLTDGTTPFSEGLYYTGDYAVINTNATNMIENHTLFYYNATSNEMLTIYEKEFNTKLGEKVWFYISATNRWGSNQYKVFPYVSSSSASDEIPTAKAVYDYIATLPTSPITTFTENITLTTSTTPFTTGLYYTGNYTLSFNTTTMLGNDILFFYSSLDNKIIRINKTVSSITSSETFSDYWEWFSNQYISAWQRRTIGIEQVISSSSTNRNVPTSFGVYQAIKNFVNGNGNSSSVVNTIWTGTETEYNALTPDSNTLYFIKE